MKKNLLILGLLATYACAPMATQTTPKISEQSQAMALFLSAVTTKAFTSSLRAPKKIFKTMLKEVGTSCVGALATIALNAAATETSEIHPKASAMLRTLGWGCYACAQNSFNPWTEGSKALKLGLCKSFKTAITTRHTKAQRLSFAINTFGPLACAYFYKNNEQLGKKNCETKEFLTAKMAAPATPQSASSESVAPESLSPASTSRSLTPKTPERPRRSVAPGDKIYADNPFHPSPPASHAGDKSPCMDLVLPLMMSGARTLPSQPRTTQKKSTQIKRPIASKYSKQSIPVHPPTTAPAAEGNPLVSQQPPKIEKSQPATAPKKASLKTSEAVENRIALRTRWL